MVSVKFVLFEKNDETRTRELYLTDSTCWSSALRLKRKSNLVPAQGQPAKANVLRKRRENDLPPGIVGAIWSVHAISAWAREGASPGGQELLYGSGHQSHSEPVNGRGLHADPKDQCAAVWRRASFTKFRKRSAKVRMRWSWRKRMASLEINSLPTPRAEAPARIKP